MKAILERKKSATAIVAASHRWAASTAESLAELLRPELAEGETLPDLELLQQLLGRALARRWQRLESADQAHELAGERCRRTGSEQTSARAGLYGRVVDLRRLLRGVFGSAASRRLLGIAGETSRDDVVLLRQASHATARLADASGDLPPASFEPTADDVERWTAPVEAAAESLRSASTLAARGAKALVAAEDELRRAIKDFDPVLIRVASVLAGVYTGAGHDGRSNAVRPSRRRLGRLLEDDDRAPTGRATTDRAPVSCAPIGRVERPATAASVSGGAAPLRRARTLDEPMPRATDNRLAVAG